MVDTTSPSSKVIQLYDSSSVRPKKKVGGSGTGGDGDMPLEMRVTALEASMQIVLAKLHKIEADVATIKVNTSEGITFKEYIAWTLGAAAALCSAYWLLNPVLVREELRSQNKEINEKLDLLLDGSRSHKPSN